MSLHYFSLEIPRSQGLARQDHPSRPGHSLHPEIPKPSFRRGRREVSGKVAPTAPPLGPPWPETIKAAASLSLHPVLEPCSVAPALCPGPAMASTRAKPTLPLLLVLVAVVIPGESEVGSLCRAGLQTPGGPRARWKSLLLGQRNSIYIPL